MEALNDTLKRIEFWQGKLPNRFALIPDTESWFNILAYHRHEFGFVCAEVRHNFHNDVNEYLAYIYKRVCYNVNYQATNKVYLKNF